LDNGVVDVVYDAAVVKERRKLKLERGFSDLVYRLHPGLWAFCCYLWYSIFTKREEN